MAIEQAAAHEQEIEVKSSGLSLNIGD